MNHFNHGKKKKKAAMTPKVTQRQYTQDTVSKPASSKWQFFYSPWLSEAGIGSQAA